jgi:LPS export ABC transporter protein LptC
MTEPDGGGAGGGGPQHRLHTRPLHAVRALRVALLLVLAGFTVALFMSYGRQGKPQARITMDGAAPAAGATVVDQSDEFAISGSREGRPAFALKARTVMGLEGERKMLDRVELTLYDPGGSSVTVAGARGRFDAATRQAQLTGDVRIETGEGLQLRTGTLYYDSDRDMIFTADDVTFAAEGIEGGGRGLNYLVSERQLKIPGDVALNVVRAAGGPPVRVTAGDLVATLADATLVFTDNARLEYGPDVLQASYLKILLDSETREVRALHAFGQVAATLRPEGSGRGGELLADSLNGRFAAAPPGLLEAEAAGNCRFTSGESTARSRTARYVREEGLLELRGDAVVMTGSDRIAAQEIDLRPDRHVLEARGEVRTVGFPARASGEGATPGFGRGAPVSFQAGTLRLEQDAGLAVYRGTARAWQEGNSLQAEEIVVDRSRRLLRATTRVMARFTETRPRGAAGAGRPLVTALTADTMVFEDATGTAAYRGNVRLTRLDATLTAEAMDARLQEKDGQRSVRSIEARGNVAVRQGASYGTAQTAEFAAGEELLVLRHDQGLAEVVDGATRRTMRGRALTFDLAGDRILTESARGGRTWITLPPDAKDVQPVEPQTRH